MAVNTQKFLPQAKTISGTKLLGSGRGSSALVKRSNISTNNFIKPSAIVKSEVSSIKVFDSTIEKFSKIESILLENNKILQKKKDTERIDEEKKSRREKEEKLEEQKEKDKTKVPGLNLPGAGILDRVKRFLLFTALGWLFKNFNQHLPKLTNVVKIIGNVYAFFEEFTGNFLNGLVDFIGFGYKVYDDTRDFVKEIGGEGAQKVFDDLSTELNKLLNGTLIAATLIASTAPKTPPKTPTGGGYGAGYAAGFAAGAASRGKGPRYRPQGQAAAGRTLGENVQRQALTRERMLADAGPKGPLDRMRRGFRGARAQLETGTLFKRGAKLQKGLYNAPGKLKGAASNLGKIGKFGGKIFGRIPIIGGLIDFAVSLALARALGEDFDPGRAAAKAVGSTAGAALGTFIPIPGVGTIIGGILGDIAGGALYDTLIGNKKKPKGHSKGGVVSNRKSYRNRGFTKSTYVKRPSKVKPKKSQPGKDVGGEKEIRKLYNDPTYMMSKNEWMSGNYAGTYSQYIDQWKSSRTKRKPNPYKALTKTAEYLKEIPLFGALMGASVDIALGEKPNERLFRNLSESFSYLVRSLANAQSDKSIANIGKEISLLASGGVVESGRGISNSSQEKVATNLSSIFSQLIKPKLDLAIKNIEKEVGKKKTGSVSVLKAPPNVDDTSGPYGAPERLGPGGPITTVPGIVDQQGRPVRFAKPAADAFIMMMDAAKKEKKPFKGSDIASTYRDPELNRRVGGAENSPHLHGLAIDVHGSTGAWIRSKGKDYGWVPYDYEGTHGGHYEYVGGGKKEKPTATLPDIFKQEPKQQPGQLPKIFEMPGDKKSKDEKKTAKQSGVASWYGPGFIGNKTANGEIFTGKEMTAAHATLPFGTMVTVTDKDTGRSIKVRINDRGPFAVDREGKAIYPLRPHPTRVIDLSETAKNALGGKDLTNVYLSYQGGGYIPTKNVKTKSNRLSSYPSYSAEGEIMLAIQPVIIQQQSPSMRSSKTYFPSSGLVNSVGANSRSTLVRG